MRPRHRPSDEHARRAAAEALEILKVWRFKDKHSAPDMSPEHRAQIAELERQLEGDPALLAAYRGTGQDT